MLKGDDGEWIFEHSALKDLAVKYYADLFKAEPGAGGGLHHRSVFDS